VQIRLLGPVEVVRDGTARPVPGLRRRAILAVLALRRGEVVSTDRLIGTVWGDAAPPTVANTLQQHVSQLRQVLGDRSAIRARPPGYVLDVGDEPTDVAAAERLIRQATGETEPALRVPHLRAALALWRGPSLADVADLPWLDEQAMRLDLLRVQARRALVEAGLAAGEHAALLPDLEELVADHPFEEQLHGQLMLALYRAGRQADALAAYRRLRDRLRDELGIEPTPAVRELETALLRQDPALAPAAPPAPVPVRVPAQLPAAVPAFAGRAAELAALDEVLGQGGIVAVSGSAGVGKTTLAVHWAHRVAGRFPDGQLYVNLRGFGPEGTVPDPAEAVRGFLDAFGVPGPRIPAGLDAQTALYRSLLAGKRVLVLLDNARDVAQVRPLLPGAPGCLVLVTSRNQLTPLVAAEGARPLGLDLLSPAEAGDLLARRLGAARVAAEPAAVEEIVARCARLPLALGIAAAQAAIRPGFPLAALAAQLRDAAGGLDAFDGGDPGSDVRVVLSWSYRALTAPAARLFRLLGVHPGPDVAVPAAASLAGVSRREVRVLLAELTQANLLTEPRPGRYAAHDLLRAYAAELVATEDPEAERRAARYRLFDHYLHTAQKVVRIGYGSWSNLPLDPVRPGVVPEEPADMGEANAWFSAEEPVLLAAIRAAAATGFPAHAWKLVGTLSYVFEARGLWREWAAAQEVALDAAERAGDAIGQAHAHHGLGRAYSWLGRDDEAFDHLNQALDRHARRGDAGAQGNVRLGLGFLYNRKGDVPAALHQSHAALVLFRAAGHRSGQAIALNNIGWSLTQLGAYPEALRYAEESLDLHQELGDLQGLAGSWDSLGYACHHLGQYQRAVTCYTAALELYRKLEHRYDQAATLVRVGDAHQAGGALPAARDAWRQAVTIFDELAHPDAEELRFRLQHGISAESTERTGLRG
jgi:DNA-binding SARP family transcriptional activator/tetratricopeptide (TPR) repeat protein